VSTPPGKAGDVSTPCRLYAQRSILVPTLTVAAGHPDTATMLARLRDTTSRAADLLALAEPEALAVHRALEHAVTGQHNETCSELIHAHRRLAALLRRSEAAGEPTSRG